MRAKQEKEHKFRNWKNTKFASMAWVLVALVLVIAIIINMIVVRLDFSWDISVNRQFSLSDTTQTYLDELDAQGKTVDFYLLADMDEIENDINTLTLYRVLRAYEDHNCINLISFDPNVESERAEALNPDGTYTLTTGDMLIQCGDNTRRIPGNLMYQTYSDDEGNVTDKVFSGENLITSTIKAVAEDFTPTVYFLTGHGEKSMDEYTTFCSNLQNYNYQAEALDLSQIAAVPDDAALILVAAPTADITDAEQEVLDAYLDEGGNITLLMSPNDGAFAYTNLEEVMENYGFQMQYDRIYETNSNNHLDGDNTTILCNIEELEDDSEAADMTSYYINNGFYALMPESRSFSYYDEGGRYTIATLLSTYDTAVGEPYGGISDDPEEINGNMVLAAYSTNNARNSSKMAVFGNAEFLDDEHVTGDTSEAMLVSVYMLLSTVSWMYDSDLDMGIVEKSTTYDYIALQNESFATTLIVVLILIPVAILVTGVVIWVVRRNS